MDAQESHLLKETLLRHSSRVRLASIFGSCRRGNPDRASDMDIFIVCEEGSDPPAIVRSLEELSPRLGRRVHTTIFNLKDFEERLRHNDYLTASILEDSSLVLGDKGEFLKARRRILAGPIDLDSVMFNRGMGFHLLRWTDDQLGSLILNGSSIHNLRLNNERDRVLLGCLRNRHLGLGYLAASAKMKQLNKVITLRQLSTSENYGLIKGLILTEKNITRKGTVNLMHVRNLFNHSKFLANVEEPLSRMKIP